MRVVEHTDAHGFLEVRLECRPCGFSSWAEVSRLDSFPWFELAFFERNAAKTEQVRARWRHGVAEAQELEALKARFRYEGRGRNLASDLPCPRCGRRSWGARLALVLALPIAPGVGLALLGHAWLPGCLVAALGPAMVGAFVWRVRRRQAVVRVPGLAARRSVSLPEARVIAPSDHAVRDASSDSPEPAQAEAGSRSGADVRSEPRLLR